MFVAIEGLDGVGKTTVSRLLASRLNAECFITPPEDIRHLRSLVEDGSPIARYMYYLVGDIVVSERIKKVLRGGRDVVCDRYILSTQVYHRALNPNSWAIDEGVLGIIQPNVTVLLTCSEEERLRRLKSRRKIDVPDAHIEGNEDLMKAVDKLYHSFLGLVEIDSTRMTAGETVDAVLRAIGGML